MSSSGMTIVSKHCLRCRSWTDRKVVACGWSAACAAWRGRIDCREISDVLRIHAVGMYCPGETSGGETRPVDDLTHHGIPSADEEFLLIFSDGFHLLVLFLEGSGAVMWGERGR